jgi:hypothetical protein
MLPKAESVREVQKLRQQLPEVLAVVPLIESAAGLVNSLEIARVPGVTRLGFGAIDFALDMNAGDRGLLAQARFQLVLPFRAANIALPLDSPSTEIRDLALVAESARTGRNLAWIAGARRVRSVACREKRFADPSAHLESRQLSAPETEQLSTFCMHRQSIRNAPTAQGPNFPMPNQSRTRRRMHPCFLLFVWAPRRSPLRRRSCLAV